MNRAVFLDRDGTIIKDVGYLGDPDRVELLPNVAERIHAIWEAGWYPILVTNQAAVGYGHITKEDVDKVNQRMIDLLEEEMLPLREEGEFGVGPIFAQVIFCPHRPSDECFCRKPNPGMLYVAAVRFGMDLRKCLMVGNSTEDVQAAKAANCPAFKVTNGLGDWNPRQLEKL
jgi:D-glycero-D-manno-heptose 1,7-bisphosphate phosphatase